MEAKNQGSGEGLWLSRPEGPSLTTTPSTVNFLPSSLMELVTETGRLSPARNHPALPALRLQPARCCASAWSLHSSPPWAPAPLACSASRPHSHGGKAAYPTRLSPPRAPSLTSPFQSPCDCLPLPPPVVILLSPGTEDN